MRLGDADPMLGDQPGHRTARSDSRPARNLKKRPRTYVVRERDALGETGMTLLRERATYEQNREHLLAIAEGRWVLIVNENVIGLYDSRAQAIEVGWARFGHRPLLTKKIERREEPWLIPTIF